MDDEDLPPPLVFPASRRWQRPRRPPILIATVKLPEPVTPPDLPPWSLALQRMLDKRGMSQSELARRMGYRKPGPVNAYLNGRREPRLVQLQALLEAMGGTLCELEQEMRKRGRMEP